MLVIPHTAAPLLLSYLVNRSQPVDLVLRLFGNDHDPGPLDTADDYEEARDYLPRTLTGGAWNRDGEAVSHPPVTIKVEGVIFGYYLTAGQTLVGAERFVRPFNAMTGTGIIEIVPRIERG